MTSYRPTTAMEVIEAALSNGQCRSLLDVGCGAGELKSRIEGLGVNWTGVDPAPPDMADGVLRARAEALPFDDRAFDAVLFLNSLHHVPPDLMSRALEEALRVLAPDAGPVIVIEPDIKGELSEALRRIDDETAVRTAAQAAIATAVRDGLAVQLEAYVYIRNERYASFEDFAARLSAADASRAEAIRRNNKMLSEDFHRLARKGDRGHVLRQPMRVCLLGRSESPGVNAAGHAQGRFR